MHGTSGCADVSSSLPALVIKCPGGLLIPSPHSFSFSPSPLAFATPPFFSCNKTTKSTNQMYHYREHYHYRCDSSDVLLFLTPTNHSNYHYREHYHYRCHHPLSTYGYPCHHSLPHSPLHNTTANTTTTPATSPYHHAATGPTTAHTYPTHPVEYSPPPHPPHVCAYAMLYPYPVWKLFRGAASRKGAF